MPGMQDQEDEKRIVKEAIKEWLDEQVLTFGKWSLRVIFGVILGALTYFVLAMNGWHK